MRTCSHVLPSVIVAKASPTIGTDTRGFLIRALQRSAEPLRFWLRWGHLSVAVHYDVLRPVLYPPESRASPDRSAPRGAALLPLLAVDEHRRADEGMGGRASQAPRTLRARRRPAQPAHLRSEEGAARGRRALPGRGAQPRDARKVR